MGRFGYQRYQQVKEHRWKVHPIWRGIGCIFVVIIPFMSIVGGRLLNAANQKTNFMRIPPDWMGFIDFTKFLQSTRAITAEMPGLIGVVQTIAGWKIYKMEAVLTVAFLIIGFGLMAILYGLMYSVVGPPRYGPVDAPPIRSSPRKGVGRSR